MFNIFEHKIIKKLKNKWLTSVVLMRFFKGEFI
jgi:hypothetical protein